MTDIKEIIKELKLKEDNVHVLDPENVNSLVNEMIQGGKDNLQVVADFDMTLSKYKHNGTLCDTSHGIIEGSPYLTPSFQKQAGANKKYYQGIEFDPSISQGDKLPHMIEWWNKSHALLVQQKTITKDLVHSMAEQSNCRLRDGCSEMFDVLQKNLVPLLIFSAGIGDLIEQIISIRHSLTDNMKVVSNFMKFDSDGLLNGFQDNIIHCLNKNELALTNTKYFDKIQSRHNIILMGDSLGDLHMADGARHAQNILKIGFLNRNIDESLDQYKRSFDIVLVEDHTLDLVNAILSRII